MTASFDWGNEVLYRMCREEPEHRDLSVIVGKVWIIGRSYAASIERKAGEKMVLGENFYLTQVAPKIKASKIDQWISSVSHIDRVSAENIDLVLRCHKNVTDLFSEISGIDKRSLAAKYLHFHVPEAFFIYDSIASRAIVALTHPDRKRVDGVAVDKPYASFCRRCLVLREKLEIRHKKKISNRELDGYLLEY